jgi:branched-chain amino acid transport system permease protein
MRPAWLIAAFIVLLAVAPWFVPPFTVTLLNYIGLYSLVALGLVLLTGVGGLPRLARPRSSAWARTRRRC